MAKTTFGFGKNQRQFREIKPNGLFSIDFRKGIITVSRLKRRKVKDYTEAFHKLMATQSKIVEKSNLDKDAVLLSLTKVQDRFNDCPISFDSKTGILDGIISCGEPNIIICIRKIKSKKHSVYVKFRLLADGAVVNEHDIYEAVAQLLVDDIYKCDLSRSEANKTTQENASVFMLVE